MTLPCDTLQGAEGTMPIGGWDLDSVMNYCNPQWLGDGNLSAMDVEGIQMIYGAKTTRKDLRKIAE